MTTTRQRLPNRRLCHTEALEIAGQVFTATVGFDPKDDSPRELFLTAGKEGSLLNAMLADAGVEVIRGPGSRKGARSRGSLPAVSMYARDPDHNLLEWMVYI